MENECFKYGCCCSCKFQEKIYKHPSNNSKLAKGSISELMGYVCRVPIESGLFDSTFTEREHSFCEEYEKK